MGQPVWRQHCPARHHTNETPTCPPCPVAPAVADGSVVSSPSPPPVSDNPTPAPSPDPSGLGPCLQVTSDDISALASDIRDSCSLSSNGSVSLDAFGWADDSNMVNVYFSSVPNIMADTADAATGLTDAACNKMSSLPQGQDVTVTWLVNDAGITCSPATGTFTLTIPTWDSTGSSSAATDLQNAAAVLPLATAPTAATATPRRVVRRRRSSGFKLVARREQQAAATASVNVLAVGTLQATPAAMQAPQAVPGVTSAAAPAAVTSTALPATAAAVKP